MVNADVSSMRVVPEVIFAAVTLVSILSIQPIVVRVMVVPMVKTAALVVARIFKMITIIVDLVVSNVVLANNVQVVLAIVSMTQAAHLVSFAAQMLA